MNLYPVNQHLSFLLCLLTASFSAADTEKEHHKPLLPLHLVAYKVNDILNVF